MIRGFDDISNDLINEICDNYEDNHDFESLINNYSYIDYYVLYSILYSTGKYNKEIYKYICQGSINEDKILIISDTHYGSRYENIKYTDSMFEFAINNGIHIILHGGDIIESNVKGHSNVSNVIKQANYFIERYPSDNSINTYAILGNHDFLAINKDKKVKDILSSRDDINILGFKKSYFDWCGTIISLKHEIEKYKLLLPSHAEYLSFKGHSHFYHIAQEKKGKSEKIYIPSMCNDPLPYLSSKMYLNMNNIKVRPGFLVAKMDNENMIIDNYSFTHKRIVKENELVKVLKK